MYYETFCFITKVNIELIRFVNGDQAKISRIGAIADVLDNYVNSSAAAPNEISFSPAIELVSKLTVLLMSTVGGSLPSNLKFEIFGCYVPKDGLATKGQIESSNISALSATFSTLPGYFSYHTSGCLFE